MAYESVKRITGKPVVLPYKCTNATATEFYAGDLVKLDGSGTIVVATTGAILGIALSGNPADATIEIDVDIITPNGDLFEMKKATANAVSDKGEIHTITFTAAAHTVADGSNDFIPLKTVGVVGTDYFLQGMFKYSSLQAVTGF
jgi:hypothetical protein